MKVLFDMTYAPAENMAGIIIFAYRLLKGLHEIHKQQEIVLLLSEENVKIAKSEYLQDFKFVTIHLKYNNLTNRIPHLRGLLNRRNLNDLITENNISLFFSPSLYMNSLYTDKIPHIGVLHDAQVYILKKQQPLKGRAFRWRMNSLLNGLTHIITISHASKESIQQIINPKTQISVIYNSVDIKSTLKYTNLDINLKRPYILYVNTLLPYKNIQTLLRAFATLKKEIKHKLVIKASKTVFWEHTLKPLINELDIDDRVVLIDARFNDDEMAVLYKRAALFVSPSLMEGFGFTPIEAAMYETPVITTRIPALYETTLGLLTYYEPATDDTILSNTIRKIISFPPAKEQRSAIATKLKEQYSTKKQAKIYYKLFKTII